jgi:cytochrome c oxidase subunit II
MPNIILLAAAIDGRFENVSTLDPSAPAAASIRFLFFLSLAISAFILAIVWGVLFYSLARFRRRRKASGETIPEAELEPPQVYGSLPIELAWTVAPALIVFLFILVIVRTELEVRASPDRAHSQTALLQIRTIGHQWWWEYQILQPGADAPAVITANELHIPASPAERPEPVFLTLESADVCHSYWIPRLAGKTDLIPGKPNEMWLQTAEPRLYLGQCAEYCGTQHAGMLLRLQVDSKPDFEVWLANESKPAVEDVSARRGKEAFLSQSCVNCHTVRGTPASGKFGPDLTHLAARQTIASGLIELNRTNLRRWIKNPQHDKPGCLMPAFGLNDEQVDVITEYLMSLK